MRTSAVLSVLVLCVFAVSARAEGPPAAEQAAFEEQVKEALPAKKPLSDGDAEGRLGTARMKRANKAAAKVVERRMEKERPSDLLLLRRAGAADVVVVSGSYDRVQDVLAAMEVKHVVIPPRLLAKLDLLATQTLMVNCPGNVSREALDKIRDFVRRGGYLVTTDWALLHVTQKAFPGTIKYSGKATPNDVVKVHVHDGKEPLLAHVKLLQDNPRWWLEGQSYPIRVLDPEKVEVLMSSPEMKRKYGHGAVVVSFRHGDGKVLHMTSHFFLQQSKLVAASEKKKGSQFGKKAGLSDARLKKEEGVDLDEVSVGDLNSAYSMQQLSTNLLVTKQKDNEKLLERYKGRITTDATLADRPTARPGKKAPRVKKDFRVEILHRKGDKVKVRDLFGNEGWVPADAVTQ